MQGVLEGFGVIAVVIALGYVLARVGVLGGSSQEVLARLVFFVGAPALLFETLSGAPVGDVFSSALVATALAVAVTAGIYITLARVWWRRPAAATTIGALSSSYVNGGNLGIPIAVYVLGDASYVAPTMLLQLVVLAPIAFAVLDIATTGRGVSVRALVFRPFRNPVTLASLLGVAVAALDVPVPEVVGKPVELIAGMAVPAALIAYGVSLRGAPRPGAGGSAREVVAVTVLKLVVQPGMAYLGGRFLLDLEPVWLLSVTLTAALPTAQNIFVYAVRYQRGIALARDSIFVTTLLSGPVILLIAALLS